MRRFAVLLAVSLSAGLVSAQDPVAEDRVPIPAQIDSWYGMEQNKEPCGYFHETLTTTTMRSYRYEYFVESEYEYTVVAPNGDELSFMVSEMLRAQLEEDFDVFDMEYTQTSSGTQGNVQMSLQLKTYPESEDRVVKIKVSGDQQSEREFRFRTTETVHLYLNPMLYRLRQTGSLAQPTRLREKVLIPGQDEPVSVSYSSGSLAAKDVLGKSVKVSEVNIMGWDRGVLAPLARIWVDKYGRVVEAESSDKSMTLRLAKDELGAKGTMRRGIGQRGRRDPFLKGPAMTPVDKTKGGPIAGVREGDKPKDAPRIEAEKFDAVLAETQALIPKLQDEMSRQLGDEAKRTYHKILQNYKGLYPLAQSDVLKRPLVEKLREDAERIYGGVRKQLEIALGKRERINDLYLNDNLEGIDREIADLKAMRQLPEFFRSEEGIAELEAAIRSAEATRAQCLARIELGKKTLVLTGTITATEVVQEMVKFDLYITGSRLAVAQPVTVRRVVTYAVINDDPYREGDIVQREGVKILKIHRHAVEVEYKGEVRQVILRK